jgi:thioredoxin 1
VIEATDGSFEREVTQAQTPVLVEFHAPWCGPCKALRPMLEQLEQRRAGALKVVGVDYQNSPGIATAYGVRSLPTLILFRQGQALGRRDGAPNSLGELETMIDGALARAG